MGMIELVINSRPDANGILWFMVSDKGRGNAEEYAGRLAMYLESNGYVPINACRTDSRIFVGLNVHTLEPDAGLPEMSPLTLVINRVSEFFTGCNRQAQFSHATHEYINAGDGNADTVGPVLYFHLYKPAKVDESSHYRSA